MIGNSNPSLEVVARFKTTFAIILVGGPTNPNILFMYILFMYIKRYIHFIENGSLFNERCIQEGTALLVQCAVQCVSLSLLRVPGTSA